MKASSWPLSVANLCCTSSWILLSLPLVIGPSRPGISISLMPSWDPWLWPPKGNDLSPSWPSSWPLSMLRRAHKEPLFPLAVRISSPLPLGDQSTLVVFGLLDEMWCFTKFKEKMAQKLRKEMQQQLRDELSSTPLSTIDNSATY
ncbi:hypothetical protein CR513_28602, partial [Mucuna pruriens]